MSVGTVSKALNHATGLRPETRQRVRQAARAFGYQANWQARALRQQRSRCLGLLLPTLSRPVYFERLNGIFEAAREHGYELVVTSAEWDTAREMEACSYLISRQVEAVIVAGKATSQESEALQLMHRRGIPMILLGPSPGVEEGVAHLCVDREGGMRRLIGHLLQLGHRRPLLVGRWVEPTKSSARLAGIRKGLADHGLSEDAFELAEMKGIHPQESYDLALRVAREARQGKRPLPTVVMGSNDTIAFGVIAGLLAAGLNVPRDVSVTGFDDIQFAAFFTPSLTTVSQTHLKLGPKAVEIAMAAIDSPHQVPLGPTVLQPELVVRQSTAPARSASDEVGTLGSGSPDHARHGAADAADLHTKKDAHTPRTSVSGK